MTDEISHAETLEVYVDHVARVLVLRVPYHVQVAGQSGANIQVWFQRLDRGSVRPARCLMIYPDTIDGREAATSLADHLMGYE